MKFNSRFGKNEMSEITYILKLLAQYSEKIDEKNITYGDYIKLKKEVENSMVSRKESTGLFDIYMTLKNKSLELLTKNI